MMDNEIRGLAEVQRDQINAISELPTTVPAPELPHHGTVAADAQTAGEVMIPQEPEDEVQDVIQIDEDIAETPVRVVPSATIYFRAQENALHNTVVKVRRYEENGVTFDLANPLASGMRAGKATGVVGVLREPIAEFFAYIGKLINQNAVFIGDTNSLNRYLDNLYNKAEHKLTELLYGKNELIGNEDFSIDKQELFSTSISLKVERDDDSATAFVEIEISIHVAQLLAGIERSEGILKNYLKFLSNSFNSAGIKTVNAGVVFDVEDFTSAYGTSPAFELFNLLVGNKLSIKPSVVVSSANAGRHNFAFEGGGNVLVLLSQKTEKTE